MLGVTGERSGKHAKPDALSVAANACAQLALPLVGVPGPFPPGPPALAPPLAVPGSFPRIPTTPPALAMALPPPAPTCPALPFPPPVPACPSAPIPFPSPVPTRDGDAARPSSPVPFPPSLPPSLPFPRPALAFGMGPLPTHVLEGYKYIVYFGI
jgi:hypothetical protein